MLKGERNSTISWYLLLATVAISILISAFLSDSRQKPFKMHWFWEDANAMWRFKKWIWDFNASLSNRRQENFI